MQRRAIAGFCIACGPENLRNLLTVPLYGIPEFSGTFGRKEGSGKSVSAEADYWRIGEDALPHAMGRGDGP